jgi:hypothetical protein
MVYQDAPPVNDSQKPAFRTVFAIFALGGVLLSVVFLTLEKRWERPAAQAKEPLLDRDAYS